MKTKDLQTIVVSLLLIAASVLTVCAQSVVGDDASQVGTPPIKGVSESSDGVCNLKSFEFIASRAGMYYTEFWLSPARYADGSYTTFLVYVNGDYVGEISPSYGNWQAARVDDSEALYFKEGKNVITVGTHIPELPAVEAVKVAEDESDASFSTNAYDDFLEKAVSGVSYDTSAGSKMQESGIYANSASDDVFASFQNVPLQYTFYSKFTFTKDQDIFITSSSADAHAIDVVYYGIYLEPVIQPMLRLSSSDQGYGANVPVDTSFTLILPPAIVKDFAYRKATSEEMQGLNWKASSRQVQNSTDQVATVRMKVPKTGIYLVRLRNAVNGGMSVADLNVNGAYFYEDVPVTLSMVDCEIPADGDTYSTQTYSANPEEDDPVLFVHGAMADRVVGFNDDGNWNGFSYLDSYLKQRYFIKASGISACNYSSVQPESYCTVVVRCLGSATSSNVKKDSREPNLMPAVAVVPKPDEFATVPLVANLNGVLSLTTSENIQRLSVYNLSGICIGTALGGDTQMSVSISSLNISQQGVYVIRIETASGTITKKMLIK